MTTTVNPRIDARRATEALRQVERNAQRLTATLKQSRWPRPQLVHDHAALFREPVYVDGQPYAVDDDLEDDD